MEDSSDSHEIHNDPQILPTDSPCNAAPINPLLSTHKVESDNVIVQIEIPVKTENALENNDEGPPIKRRRLTDSTTPQRSSSRAASPPWKKVGVEGPTTFFSGGKRKSARTNAIPVELQPQTDKRKTRASLGQGKYGSTSLPKSSSLVSTPKENGFRVKQPRIMSTTGTQTSKHYTSKPSSAKAYAGNTKSPVTPTRQSHRRKSLTQKALETSSPHKPPSPIQKRRPGRPPRNSINKMEADTKMTNGGHGSSDEENVDCSEDEEDEDEDEDTDVSENTMDVESEDPVLDPNVKPQRLRFKVKPPAPPPIQHPSQITPKKQFASLRELLDNDDPFEGSNITIMSAEDAKREARSRNRLYAAAQPGKLLDPNCSSAMKPDPEEEPPIQRTRHDFMVTHALYFAKLLRQEHRKHTENAKKLAVNAQAKWRANQPKATEEVEIEMQQRERLVVQATHKQCLRDLVAKWELLRGEVEVWRFERWKEEQEAQDKETLNRVLEESSKLLDSSRIVEESSDDNSSENSEAEGDDVEAGTTAERNDSEENVSSDEDEDEAEDGADANPDDQLTAEELKRKYSLANPQDPDRPPDPDAHHEEMQPLKAQTETTLPDYGKAPLPSGISETSEVNDLAIRSKSVETEEQALRSHDGLSEDESTEMEWESSDAESEEEEEGDEDESSDEDDSIGLYSLLGDYSKLSAPIAQKNKAANGIDESQSTPATPRYAENTMISEFEEEEPEEVSLVPDAAQVQTPTSNNEEPYSIEALENSKPATDVTMSDLPVSYAVDEDVEDESSQAPQSLSADETRPLTRDSVPTTPATPISVDLDKKHIPVQEIPHLLRGTLREYQMEGFYWLADRYNHNANGILADEMGLGKTIQTITLLAHLAVKHHVWGPHLVVVPTSVILNWEMEFKKFLPGFKILPYYGNQEERKQKRKGWLDDDRWNVVITSYQLIVSDQNSFKRRFWQYLILDEAHNIKNFRSQRWQTLLTFRSRARLLLTGTPLQNNLEELWSLLFFLVGPDKAEEFLGRQEFSQLFKKPADQILENDQQHLDAEGREQVQKLHHVLRPRLLRRLKADVEKQMPGKYEHVVYCKLSKRQRYLYDGFLSRSQTRETLARGNYLSIINCLMQLRKVCNHPDLFETRPIVTSFAMPRSAVADFEIKDLLVRRRLLSEDPLERVSLDTVDLLPGANGPVSALDTIQKSRLGALYRIREISHYLASSQQIINNMYYDGSTTRSSLAYMENVSRITVLDNIKHAAYLTSLKSQRRPLYSDNLTRRLTVELKSLPDPPLPRRRPGLSEWLTRLSPVMQDIVKTLSVRSELMREHVTKFSCVTPAVVVPDLYETTLSKPVVQTLRRSQYDYPEDAFHESRVRLSIAFPDKRLLQFDCGKLQRLDTLLRKLQSGGHRALIFTQMTKVLDILEQFLNIHGHRYLRLDGSTKLEQRQILTERFNSDTSILAFILSSRSGGLGINLTGADTVIFYDLDWNPAMDKQCQDRCHRIGQTRDVHIYRFVSEHTIEANILRKSNQKRLLDDVIIQEGDFTTEYLNKSTAASRVIDDPAFEEENAAHAEASAAFDRVLGIGNTSGEDPSKIFEQAEDREDVAAARIAEKEIVHADEADFAEREAGPGHAQVNQTTSSSNPHPNASNPTTDPPNVSNLASKPSAPTDPNSMPPSYERGDVAPRTDMSSDIFLERQPVGVDRYVVEYLEWELRNVPYVPPAHILGKKKKKGRVEEVRTKKPHR